MTSSDILIVGVDGSPRKSCNGGFTEEKLLTALGRAEVSGAKVLHLKLSDYHLKPHNGSFSSEAFAEATDDDANQIMQTISRADGLILATPVKYFSSGALMQNFLERMHPVEHHQHMTGKVGAVIVYGPEGGSFEVHSRLLATLAHWNMVVAPCGAHYDGVRPHVTWPNKDLPILADNMIRLIEALRATKTRFNPGARC